MGKKSINHTGVVVPGKKHGPSCECKKLCTDEFTQEEKKTKNKITI